MRLFQLVVCVVVSILCLSLSVHAITETPTAVPQTPTFGATPTPTPTSTMTVTARLPISTFRPTEFPVDPAGNPVAMAPYVNLRVVAQGVRYAKHLAVSPVDGSLYYTYFETVKSSWLGYPWQLTKTVYTIKGPLQPSEGYLSLPWQQTKGQFDNLFLLDESIVITPEQNIYIADDYVYYQSLPSQFERSTIRANKILYIKSGNSFLNAPEGEVLVFYDSFVNGPEFRSFPTLRDPPVARALQLPNATNQFMDEHYLYDMTWGPGGMLYAMVGKNLVRFDSNGSYTIVYQSPDYIYRIIYLSQDRAFYLLHNIWQNSRRFDILSRLPEGGSEAQPVIYSTALNFNGLVAAPDGGKLYFDNHADAKIWELNPRFEPGQPIMTPTPTRRPGDPTPTPTPADWLMLDGFGGIHTSGEVVRKPVLPYFIPFNIVRDLEPDPLGRGWYMLDGFGGVHTSSPELPLPFGLPYFGFDIARDLEIIEQGGQLTFFLLDGHGAVHKTGPLVNEIQVDSPWFARDVARDLEPTEDGEGWYVLDAYGAKYDSRDFSVSVGAGTYWYDLWFARDLLVLLDGNSLMLDAFGGRHTENPDLVFNRLKPIPADLYFGFDIVWDFELLPENMR